MRTKTTGANSLNSHRRPVETLSLHAAHGPLDAEHAGSCSPAVVRPGSRSAGCRHLRGIPSAPRCLGGQLCSLTPGMQGLLRRLLPALYAARPAAARSLLARRALPVLPRLMALRPAAGAGEGEGGGLFRAGGETPKHGEEAAGKGAGACEPLSSASPADCGRVRRERREG